MCIAETNALNHCREKQLKLLSLLQAVCFNQHDKYEGEERMCPFQCLDNSQYNDSVTLKIFTGTHW